MQYQLGIWEPSQHLLEDRGKPRKSVSGWPVAGPSGIILTTSQQYGKQRLKNKSPGLSFPKISSSK
jgi:hypothetical protein